VAQAASSGVGWAIDIAETKTALWGGISTPCKNVAKMVSGIGFECASSKKYHSTSKKYHALPNKYHAASKEIAIRVLKVPF
jgi:hypothetical protein